MGKIVFGNMIIYKDKKYNFIEYFNPNNGFLIRSDILNRKGENPLQRSYPELLDIGIMGQCHIAKLDICKKAGIDCYQKAKLKNTPNMSVEDYEKILVQSKNKTFQIALGGAGDPNKHENFAEILELTREYNIVPNLTTSGMYMIDREISLMKTYCGACAISFYSRLDSNNNETNKETIEAIERLVDSKCITNIHFVLSKETIEEAIIRLENNLFPKGINAIIFILYKSAGFGSKNKILNLNNIYFQKFLNIINENKFAYQIGFDTCCTPAILKSCSNIPKESLDFCEAARFSMYIDAEMNAYPCSFDCTAKNWAVSLKNTTIKEVWNSKVFSTFREKYYNSCTEESCKINCGGKCALDLCQNICKL